MVYIVSKMKTLRVACPASNICVPPLEYEDKLCGYSRVAWGRKKPPASGSKQVRDAGFEKIVCTLDLYIISCVHVLVKRTHIANREVEELFRGLAGKTKDCLSACFVFVEPFLCALKIRSFG